MVPLVTYVAISYHSGPNISRLFKDCSIKKYLIQKIEILPLVVYTTPDEIQDTYVEINADMLLNANTYNTLIQKPKQ